MSYRDHKWRKYSYYLSSSELSENPIINYNSVYKFNSNMGDSDNVEASSKSLLNEWPLH